MNKEIKIKMEDVSEFMKSAVGYKFIKSTHNIFGWHYELQKIDTENNELVLRKIG